MERNILILSVVLFLLPWNVIGQRSTTKCFGAYFTDTLCPASTYIEVKTAEYGVSPCSTQPGQACCVGQQDCTIPIQQRNPAYYTSIKDKCNGFRVCQGLIADWTTAFNECGVTASDYIILFFNCISDGSTTSTSISPGTDVTSQSGISTVTHPGDVNGTTPYDGLPQGTFNPLGLCLGIVAGLLFAFTPFVIGIIIIKRRKKAAACELEAQNGAPPGSTPGDDNDGYYDEEEEEWDDDWSDDWENYSMEDPTGEGVDGRKPSHMKGRKSRKSKRAVPNEYTHTDDIYDIIDPTTIAGDDVMDDVTDDVTKETKTANGHAGVWPDNTPPEPNKLTVDSTLTPNGSASKLMVNNEVYSSDKPEGVVTEDVYLEPVLGKDKELYEQAVPYDNSVDDYHKEQAAREGRKPSEQYDGLEFTQGTTGPKESYETLDRSTFNDQPGRNRKESTVSDIYWSVDGPDDSNV